MNKKKKVLLVCIFLVGILLVVGLSYAYWLLYLSQTSSNKISTSCFSLSLTNEKNNISLEYAYPILDEEGKKLTPYSFTITNTCDLFADYTINLEILKDSTMPIKYINALMNNESIVKLSELEDTKTTIEGAISSKILAKGSLGSGDSMDYNLRLWMAEDVSIDDKDSMNTIFLSQVTLSATRGTYNPIEQGYTTLASAILADEYQTNPEVSKKKIAAKQTPDFSRTAPIAIWKANVDMNISYKYVSMPHPDLVALKDSDARFKNLTSEKVLLPIGTDYTIDPNTGRYSINNVEQLDPTKLTYNDNKKYYYCTSGYGTDSNDVISVWKTTSNCMNILEITGATYEDDEATGNGGSTFKIRKYTMTGHSMTQIETESDKSDKGLYQMEDEDGISYYYRGSANNNYVKFAGYYWRIIRINGDGSVRLLYAGTTSDATGTSLFNKVKAKFQTQRDNPGYVGYMYGSNLNESYEKTTANVMSSEIKNSLDDWYKENILGTDAEKIVVDAGFCNDRSIISGSGYTDSESVSYGPQDRYINTKQPTLKCPQTNDLFTLSTNEKGNKALTHPIGLITVDELMLSGYADGYINRLNYAYSSSTYWTMSPRSYNATVKVANAFFLSPLGYLNSNWVTDNYGIRAVINIKGDAKITGGTGIASNPYEISLE